MKLIRNQGSDTVLAELNADLPAQYELDIATPHLSLFAVQEARRLLLDAATKRMIMPSDLAALNLFGTEADRAARNRLNGPALARQLATWLSEAAIKFTDQSVPQGVLGVRTAMGMTRAVAGQCALSTSGLGLTPGHPLSLIQGAQTPEEAGLLGMWFDQMWSSLSSEASAKAALLTSLARLSEPNAPSRIYHAVLYSVFKDLGDELDEERIVRSGT